MSIIRWRPMRSLSTDLDRFFNEFGLDYHNTDSVWAPSVDLAEFDNSYSVKAELPGLNKDEIKITFKDDMLVLAGEKKLENEEKKENYHRIERRYGKFQRAFHLPHVNADSIKADYKDGVLTVEIPKAEDAKPKEIAVK